MDPAADETIIDRRLVVRPGRHFGWWLEGRRRRGRLFTWTWWPTKGLAMMVARFWARMLRRKDGTEVPIEEGDART